MKATFIRQIEGWTGDARLYKVSPPMTYNDYQDDDDPKKTTDHVIVSATVVMFSGPETYIFPADDNGECVNFCELEGSFRGSLDHEESLYGAGYRVEA